MMKSWVGQDYETSDNTLYLCKVLPKYLKGDLNSRIDAKVIADVEGQTYGRMNGWKTGSLYHTMPAA